MYYDPMPYDWQAQAAPEQTVTVPLRLSIDGHLIAKLHVVYITYVM